MTGGKAAAWLFAGIIVLACVARVAHLDADPYFPTWTQYVVDEGRWNAVARNLALFGNADTDFLARLHLILSPGYQAVNYVAFRLFGVEFWSARAFAAVSGTLIVLGAFLALRRHVTAFAMALGLVILAFETNLLAESRLALPEIPSLLGMLCAFLVLVVGRKSRLNAFLAGVLGAVAAAMKGTSALIVPVLPLIVLLSSEGGSWRERITRTLALAAGFVLPLLVGLGLASVAGVFDARALASAGGRVLNFFSFADARLIVWRYFESTQLEVRNLLLLGAWFCSWLWFHRDRNAGPVTRQIYLMSGLWAAWWLVLWSINDYSPGRYVVHFVVPATIHIMAGLSLGGGDTIARISASLARSRGFARVALLAWLVLPTAIVAATVATWVGPWLSLDVSRVSARIAVIAALAAAIAAPGWRSGPAERAVAGCLAFPVVMALVWLGGRELGVWDAFWEYDFGTGQAIWVVLCALAAAACFAKPSGQGLARRTAAAQWTVICLTASIFLAQAAHPVLAPSYSIRDAARRIPQVVSDADVVRTLNASSLFLANKLRYREHFRYDMRPDVLVIFEHNRLSLNFLESPRAVGFERVQAYPVTVHPRYKFDPKTSGPLSVGVYRAK